MNGETAGDIENKSKEMAARVAATARTAKAGAKAVSQAASGNVAGAALTLLKDEGARKVLGALLLAAVLLNVYAMILVPMSVYESVSSWNKAVTEAYEEARYAGGNGAVDGTIKGWFAALMAALAPIKAATEAVSMQERLAQTDALWNSGSYTTFRSDLDFAQNNGEGELGTDEDLSADALVDQIALTDTYRKKIEAVQDKFYARISEPAFQNAIESAIRDALQTRYSEEIREELIEICENEYGYITPDEYKVLTALNGNGQPVNTAADYSLHPENYILAASRTSSDGKKTTLIYRYRDPVPVETYSIAERLDDEDVKFMNSAPKLSGQIALKLMCLYTAQYKTNLETMSMGDFLKWLGYNGKSSRSISWQIGSNEGLTVTASKAWTGTFMPQYLVNEMYEYAIFRKSSASGAMSAGEEYDAVMKEYQEQYGTSVLDMMLVINCPKLSTLRYTTTDETAMTFEEYLTLIWFENENMYSEDGTNLSSEAAYEEYLTANAKTSGRSILEYVVTTTKQYESVPSTTDNYNLAALKADIRNQIVPNVTYYSSSGLIRYTPYSGRVFWYSISNETQLQALAKSINSPRYYSETTTFTQVEKDPQITTRYQHSGKEATVCHQMTVNFAVPITYSLREDSALTTLAGLWEGYLTSSAPAEEASSMVTGLEG